VPDAAARRDAGATLTAFTPEASAALGGPDWLVRARASAGGRLEGLKVPTEAEEIWRYSGIDDFDLAPFAPSPPASGGDGVDQARALADHFGPRCALVVTRQGFVTDFELEPGCPPGLVSVAGTGPSAIQGTGSAASDGELLPTGDDAFSILHDAFVAQVVQIAIPERAVVGAPVVVVHLVDPSPGPGGAAPACFPHVLVRLGRGAEAGIVEISADDSAAESVVRPGADGAEAPARRSALVLPVTELTLADEARLAYANLQVLGHGVTHIGLQRSHVGARGSLRSFTVGLGGRYSRVRTDSELLGEGSSGALLAAYLGVGDQVHDFRTLQDHGAARTDSELLFTGAVADRARSVYSGLIRIRRGARRADARQTNHNLVLSEGAHADSVPNLDIDENDVRCSHASTVGPIDEEQRYYLESRGIEPAAAEQLIVLGFFADLAARSPFPEVGRWVTDTVERRLTGRLPAEQADEPALAGADRGGASGG
jgi:Fe-S cluster assembly protein SufD